jgi:hypothetical protein
MKRIASSEFLAFAASFNLYRAAFSLAALLAITGCAAGTDPSATGVANPDANRYQRAQALFEERCKSAGVVINRVVKDVEGIELTKIRPQIPWGGREYFDPMYPGAAMANEAGGDTYIRQMLFSEYKDRLNPGRRGPFNPPGYYSGPRLLGVVRGYEFVEYFNQETRERYRVSILKSGNPSDGWSIELDRRKISSPGVRYALDYEYLVDPADRNYWIAGAKLRVIDLQSGEVLGTLTRYVFDPGFGSGATGRWPWQHASIGMKDRVCPATSDGAGLVSRTFVESILIPRQGE